MKLSRIAKPEWPWIAAPVALAAISLVVMDFPRWWTQAYLVAGLALLFVLSLLGRSDAPPESVALPAQPAAEPGDLADDAPRRLVEARRRAADRRARGGTVKTKVRRG